MVYLSDKNSIKGKNKNMLPVWVRRLGKWRLLGISSLVSGILSVSISALLMWLLLGSVNMLGLLIGLLIPLIVGTPNLYFILQLLFRLDKTQGELQYLAVTDELTHTYNRRYLFLQIEKEIERCKRYGGVFSLLMIDCDNFKEINDQYGHPAGDSFLVDLTRVIKTRIRSVDVLARVGGDEFIILLPNTTAAQASNVSHDLHLIINQMEHAAWGSSVSMGVTTWNPLVDGVTELHESLDRALYTAKQSGKNRVEIY